MIRDTKTKAFKHNRDAFLWCGSSPQEIIVFKSLSPSSSYIVLRHYAWNPSAFSFCFYFSYLTDIFINLYVSYKLAVILLIIWSHKDNEKSYYLRNVSKTFFGYGKITSKSRCTNGIIRYTFVCRLFDAIFP